MIKKYNAICQRRLKVVVHEILSFRSLFIMTLT